LTTRNELQIAEHTTKKQYTVFYDELLRDIPGKRSVYRGKWQDKPVIIKIFNNSFSSKKRLQIEWQGLTELKSRNINVPEVYLKGQNEKDDQVLVIQEITDCQTALERIAKAENIGSKIQIYELLVDELAKLNEAGIAQTDLHLGNFLIQNKMVYPLDTAQMKFYGDALGKHESIKQIAILCWYIEGEETGHQDELFQRYAKLRGWRFDKNDKKLARQFIKIHYKKAVKKGLKKCLRTSKRQIRIKTNEYLAVVDRDFHYKTDVESLIDNIDAIMEKGKILKNGRTCFVTSFDYQGVNIVVKRYNNKGLLHSLRRTLRRSRGRKAWLNGHLLTMLRINTPRPLAFVNIYKNSLIISSYIITELVEGKNLHFYLEENQVSDDEKQKIKNELNSIVNTMHENMITHGDIKRSNMLITDKGVCVTDLDAMVKHKFVPLYLYHKNKDEQKLKELFEEM
jgi:tRNA A-37 threonylcarbamoyl transferase component Bud32